MIGAAVDAISDRAIDIGNPNSGLTMWLEDRLGVAYAMARIGKEARVEASKTQGGLRHKLALSYVVDTVVPHALRLSGMLARGSANASRIEVRRNRLVLPGLPNAFEGFTILHLTDLHADTSVRAMLALPDAIEHLDYDICVITGDFRGKMFGPYDRTLEMVGMALSSIRKPLYGILGNHDTAAMLPGLEAMGVRMLMNEAEAIARGMDRLWIAGIDDPHLYKTNDLRAALMGIPETDNVVLLSHSADGYQEAERARVDAFLCGHTHGGQICLPGGIPVMTCSRLPRRLLSGRWCYGRMDGYTSKGVGTSAIDAQFNCPPEVTLHTLRKRGVNAPAHARRPLEA